MSLLGTARALDDARFLWRVRAAMLSIAVTKYGSENTDEKSLAQEILDSPMQQNRTMEALVANDLSVGANIETDDMNTVNTESVTDDEILTATLAYWPAVATRRTEKLAESSAKLSSVYASEQAK